MHASDGCRTYVQENRTKYTDILIPELFSQNKNPLGGDGRLLLNAKKFPYLSCCPELRTFPNGQAVTLHPGYPSPTPTYSNASLTPTVRRLGR